MKRWILLAFLVVVAGSLILMVGCGGQDDGWDLSESSPTDIVPDCTNYTFVTNQAINDSHHIRFVFYVEKDSQDKPVVVFSTDGQRWDRIAIDRGTFYYTWGDINGTNCPTDSYGISGHFTKKGKAEGFIKLTYDSCIVAKATFVAKVEP